MATSEFQTHCDSTTTAMDLWSLAEADLPGYIEKAAHRHRLKRLGLDDVIPYSLTFDLTDVVPLFDGKSIKNYELRITN